MKIWDSVYVCGRDAYVELQRDQSFATMFWTKKCLLEKYLVVLVVVEPVLLEEVCLLQVTQFLSWSWLWSWFICCRRPSSVRGCGCGHGRGRGRGCGRGHGRGRGRGRGRVFFMLMASFNGLYYSLNITMFVQ